MFQMSLSEENLRTYVFKQIDHFFPDGSLPSKDPLVLRAFEQALSRSEYCFRHVALKAFHHEGRTFFSHLHSDQYTLFLWFLSNSVWKELNDEALATKLFYLNKALHGVACMFDTNMPDIFLILHGCGIVLGKAEYSDFFVCYQGCTVGAIKGVYPKLGRGVAMAPQSSIIGNCLVGEGTTIGNNTLVRNMDLKSGSLYYMDSNTQEPIIRQGKEPWAQSFFNIPITRDGERHNGE